MNSKIIFLLSLLCVLSSCGVKAPPEKYPSTVVESYIRGYTGADPTPEEMARNKKPAESKTESAKTPALLPQP